MKLYVIPVVARWVHIAATRVTGKMDSKGRMYTEALSMPRYTANVEFEGFTGGDTPPTSRGQRGGWWDVVPREALLHEWVKVFKRARSHLFLYRTRSKASATLDKKNEGYCTDLMARHQVFVRL